MENTKEIKINIPEGYEIDKDNSTFENIILKKIEDKKPKSWDEHSKVYRIDGSLLEECNLDTDLFFAPVKKKGKVFLYKDDTGNICCDAVILDEHSDYVRDCDHFIEVTDIEWEE